MKWKVIVEGDKPSEQSVLVLAERTGLFLDKILMAFSNEEQVVCNGLSEGEAQEIADSLRRDPGIHCRILPDDAKPVLLYRVLLVNYRSGYRTRLRRRLQKLTHLPQEQIVLWLSRMPFAISRGIDSETAKRIKRSVTDAGGIVRIEAELQPQESVSRRRTSNVVFRTRKSTTDSNEINGDSPFTDQSGKTDDSLSSIPSVCVLPAQYSIGPPPIDEFETSSGKVFLHPPVIYAVGLPSKSLEGGFRETPPVLPDVSNRSIPETVEFSPPLIVREDIPPVVGGEERDSSSFGPPPDIVILFPPFSSISEDLLLPPVLGESLKSRFPAEDDSPYKFPTDIDPESDISISRDGITPANADDSLEHDEAENGVLKLFLCTPSPEDKEKIAEAIRDVIGVSLRESWDLLGKTPSLLETCVDFKRAIRIAHKLESRGVTVSLTRGNMTTARTSADSGTGFQAWLSKNG